jgi:hypothetical protein
LTPRSRHSIVDVNVRISAYLSFFFISVMIMAISRPAFHNAISLCHPSLVFHDEYPAAISGKKSCHKKAPAVQIRNIVR